MSEDLIRLCAIDEIEEAEGLGVDAGGVKVAVWKVGDTVFATGDVCSHGEASLSADGMIEGIEIICALHMGSFDVRTGEAMSAPCHRPIPTYKVTLIEGDVYIEDPS